MTHRWMTLPLIGLLAACAAPTSDAPPAADIDDKEDHAEQASKADGWLPCPAAWDGDGVCDRACRGDSDCAPVGESVFGDVVSSPTAHPLVLLHGFNATRGHLSFDGAPEDLGGECAPCDFADPADTAELQEACDWGDSERTSGVCCEGGGEGHRVYVASAPPFRSEAVRGTCVARHIDLALEHFGADRVNVLAHSMGGLDSRFAITELGYGDRIASLTTFGTPHRGAPAADLALGLTFGADIAIGHLTSLPPRVVQRALDALGPIIGGLYSEQATESDVIETMWALSEARGATQAERYPDDPQVFYQSYAGVTRPFGLNDANAESFCAGRSFILDGRHDAAESTFLATWHLTAGHESESNDGVVTVSSAMGGERLCDELDPTETGCWHFRGCVPADHHDLIATNLNPITLNTRRDEPLDEITGYSARDLHRRVAAELADLGY